MKARKAHRSFLRCSPKTAQYFDFFDFPAILRPLVESLVGLQKVAEINRKSRQKLSQIPEN
jgi:hypothetical protein